MGLRGSMAGFLELEGELGLDWESHTTSREKFVEGLKEKMEVEGLEVLRG